MGFDHKWSHNGTGMEGVFLRRMGGTISLEEIIMFEVKKEDKTVIAVIIALIIIASN
jgi:hypothetical protein